MSWWMGAGLGFLRGGPFGAVVGAAAEHFLGKKSFFSFEEISQILFETLI